MTEKRCGLCGQVLPLDAFSLRRRAPDGRQDRCRACMRSYFREWAKSHPRAIPARKHVAAPDLMCRGHRGSCGAIVAAGDWRDHLLAAHHLHAAEDEDRAAWFRPAPNLKPSDDLAVLWPRSERRSLRRPLNVRTVSAPHPGQDRALAGS